MPTRSPLRPVPFLPTALSLKLATALACAGMLAACGPLPSRLDPTSETYSETDARPAMSLRWKRVLADRARERKPQEFASAAVGLGPARDRDAVFIGSHEGTLHAIEAETGRTLWEAQVGSVSSQPVIARGRLYIGNDDGVLHCLDVSTGEELWRYVSKGPILQPPVIANELILFSNEADHVYALDRASGEFRWQYKTETPDDGTLRGHSGVAVVPNSASGAGELAYVGFSNGNLVALRVASGSVAWLKSLSNGEEQFLDVDVTPVVVGNTVYAASSAGGLYAVDRTVGRVNWRRDIEGVGALAADERRLYAVAADVGAYALDHGGNVIWRHGTDGGGEPAAAVLVGDYLLYSLSDAGLYVSDKNSGRVLQFFDPGFGISSVPALARDAMYVMSNSAVLYALSLRSF